uniref:Immunoglobulin domain-containing protein n=1 Tax=Monopterus albus TaxID=43700 RepID=A0A3Q3Q0T6_MONAL
MNCAIEIHFNIIAIIIINTFDDTCCDSVNKIQSYEGGSVSISCPYDPEYQNNQKYMCRGKRPSTCLQQAVVTSNNKQSRQYSLTDDKERRTFTVTITGLAQRDSGLYLCGVHRNTGLDVFSAVELEVKVTSSVDPHCMNMGWAVSWRFICSQTYLSFHQEKNTLCFYTFNDFLWIKTHHQTNTGV